MRNMNCKNISEQIIRHEVALKKLRNELKIAEYEQKLRRSFEANERREQAKVQDYGKD